MEKLDIIVNHSIFNKFVKKMYNLTYNNDNVTIFQYMVNDIT